MKRRLSLVVLLVSLSAARLHAAGVMQQLTPVSLSSGQTVRLTVLDSAAATEVTKGKARKWTLAFDVYATDSRVVDGDGSVRTSSRVRFLRRESTSVMLSAGEGASFDFVTADGKMIVPCVMGPPDAKESSVSVGVEVREGGRTIIVLPAVQRGFNPQPDPPGEK